MNRRTLLLPLCLLSLLMFAQNGQAQAPIILKTEFQDAAPKFIQAQDGKFTGVCLDIMDLIEKKTHIRFSYPNAFVPSKRIEANQESGVTDIHFGRAMNPEQKKVLNYGEKLYSVYYPVVIRKDDKIDLKSISDLARLGEKGTVLSLFGISTTANLKKIQGLQVDDRAPDTEANLEKLAAGRGRAFIYHNLGVGYALRQEKFKDKFRVVRIDYESNSALQEASHYVVFSKKVPSDVIELINKVIRDAREKEIKAILAKYSSP